MSLEFLEYKKSGRIEARMLVDSDLPVIQSNGESTEGQLDWDWLARDPDNHRDQWIIPRDYFSKNYESA